jgi:hypothetical protein
MQSLGWSRAAAGSKNMSLRGTKQPHAIQSSLAYVRLPRYARNDIALL